MSFPNLPRGRVIRCVNPNDLKRKGGRPAVILHSKEVDGQWKYQILSFQSYPTGNDPVVYFPDQYPFPYPCGYVYLDSLCWVSESDITCDLRIQIRRDGWVKITKLLKAGL